MANMQLRNIVFTLNNYTQDEYDYLLALDIFKYLVVGKEVGVEGTKHLQGYALLNKRTLFNKVKKLLPRYHIEPRRGSHSQASEYCKKDGDYIEIGEPPKQGKRTDLEEVADKLKEGVDTTTIARDHTSTYIKYYRGIEQTSLKLQSSYEHSDVRGIWIWGSPGSGKSWSVRQQYPNLYLKAQNKWWDGYNGESTVVLDDLDTPLLGHHLKIWSDRYACTGETKGGTIHLRHHRFIVTSNYPPEHFWPDDAPMLEAIMRRFNIFEKNSLETELNF